MVQVKTNIGIVAQPRVGKSTLMNAILKQYSGNANGLLTREIKEGNERVGFEMGSFGNTGEFMGTTIAHVNIQSPFKVSKYGIDQEAVRLLSLAEWKKGIVEGNLLYLDEIGQMQANDENFKDLVKKFFGSDNVCIATISAVYNNSLIEHAKSRKDTVVFGLTVENRSQMLPFILGLIKKIKKAKMYALQPDLFTREGNLVELQSDHGKRIINLSGRTCTCDFYGTFKEFRVCSHILAAEAVFGE